MSLQQEIDDLKYPPTHTYNLETLQPSEILAERVDLLPREFFRGQRFLDIGCNKGFFTLYASTRFEKVVAFDNDQRFVDICNKIKHPNTTILHTTFRDFYSFEQFDRIFIGNTHHYLFRECGGWEWVNKLAALSSDQVLIEGPISMACADMKNCLPVELWTKFNYNDFIEAMSKHFELISKHPTTNYTQERYIMLFKKKPKITIDPSNLYHKKYQNFGDDYTLSFNQNNIVGISIAESMPHSNPVIAFDDSGWYEEKIESEKYDFFENERNMLKLICDNQIYLAKLGYWDIDTSMINFFKPKNIYFDKSGILPIATINARRIEAFKLMFKNSYKTLTLPESLLLALESKDSIKIEEEWKKLRLTL